MAAPSAPPPANSSALGPSSAGGRPSEDSPPPGLGAPASPSSASLPAATPPATGPSFKEVATRQSHSSGQHAAIPEAPALAIQMPQEALVHARHYSKHALVCSFNGFWPSISDLISWISTEWNPLLDGEVIACPCAKGFFVVVFESTSDIDKVFNSGPWF